MAKSPLANHIRTDQKPKKDKKRIVLTLAGLGLLIPLIGSSFAATITINSGSDIEFGQGTEDVAGCTSSALAAFESSLSGSNLYISKVTISSINTNCGGKYLRARLLTSTGATLDDIVWAISAGTGNSWINAIADGSTTTTSDSGDTMLNYPSSETGDAGLKNSMLSSSLADILLETASSEFTES